MRVLLLGGSGFIGAHVARAMIDAGHDVTVLSRGTRPPIDGADGLVADRRDPAALAAALDGRRFDFTVDFAAYDAADVEKLLLVPYAALGPYVMISSGQVYLVTAGAQAPFREEASEHPLRPEPPRGTRDHAGWSYGVGKRLAERALRSLRASHGVRSVVLRLPIVLGAADTSLRLWGWIERMLDGGPIVLPDGGHRPTRFLYVGDVAGVLIDLLARPRTREVAYNLAGPDTLALHELLARIARAAGREPRFVACPGADMERAGVDPGWLPYSGPWVSVLDPARAAAEWGFTGSRLEDYLPEVVRWYLEHRPAASDLGYAQRAREIELAGTLDRV